MYLIIEDFRSGEIVQRRMLEGQEVLDIDLYSQKYVDEVCCTVAGDCPAGAGGDICVTLQEDPGSACCWSSKAYFLAGASSCRKFTKGFTKRTEFNKGASSCMQ